MGMSSLKEKRHLVTTVSFCRQESSLPNHGCVNFDRFVREMICRLLRDRSRVLNEKNEEPESEVKKMATGEDGKAILIHVVKCSYKDALINSEV